jgi:hypothetical protein
MKKYLFIALLFSVILYSNAQNTGIGITTPRAPFHLYTGPSGNTTPYHPMVVEGGGNTYINMLAYDIYETGILFGNSTNAANGGIIYNNLDPWPGTMNGFQFRTNGNATRMVLTGDGNVGIGVMYPQEKLDVAGSIRAQSFKYSTPKQSYHSIPGAAFTTATRGDTLNLSIGGGTATLYSVLNTKMLIAPLQLPDKVTMQDMTVYFADNSSSVNYEIVLYRKTITSNLFPDNIGTTTTSGSSSTLVPYTIPINTVASNNVVDNSLYTYYIVIMSFGNFPWAFNSVVGAAVIRYTMTEPL